jgi:hypothetical protein
MGSYSSYRIGQFQFCSHKGSIDAALTLLFSEEDRDYGEDLGLERPPFLLAVDFDAGVIRSTLSVAKQVRDVCSFPPFLNFPHFHGKSVENRCRKWQSPKNVSRINHSLKIVKAR